MAIGEKKSILRQMHERTDAARAEAAAQAQAAATPPSAPVFERRAELPVRLLVFTLVLLFFGTGVAAALYFCNKHYEAGSSFSATGVSRAVDYMSDMAKLGGIIILLGLLGTLALIVFRETLSRAMIWVAGVALVLLAPVGIAALPAMVISFNNGREAAWAALDRAAIHRSSVAISARFRLPDITPRYIMPGDPEWADVPQHIRDTLKPSIIYIYNGGTVYLLGGSWPFDVEAVFVPNYPMRPTEVDTFANSHGDLKVLQRDPPVFGISGYAHDDAFLAPGTTSPSSTLPFGMPGPGGGMPVTPVPWSSPATPPP